MIVSLIIGRKNSKRLPNKNLMLVAGKTLATYSMNAALNSKLIQKVFISTDCNELKKIGVKSDIYIINRPDHLASDEALVEDVIAHAFFEIENQIGKIKYLVVLFANVATISSKEIDKGLNLLMSNPDADSVVSVVEEKRYSATRAKAINKDWVVHNSNMTDNTYNYFYNGCLWISRAKAIKVMNGQARFKWIGKKIIPLIQEFGLDINYDYEVILTEYWLNKKK